MSASTRVFLGLLLGALLGWLSNYYSPESAQTFSAIVQPIGRLWLNALQMTIVPLVVSLLIVGINQASDVAESGRVARRALFWMIGLLFAAALASAIAASFILNFMPHNPELMHVLQQALPHKMDLNAASKDWTSAIISTNVIAAAAQTAIVPLIVFTLLFAFAVTQIHQHERSQLVGFFKSVSETVIVMINWILWLGPIGVFALIFPLSAQIGSGVVKALGIYIGMLCILYGAITLILYAVACMGKGEKLHALAKAILPAQIVAMSTQSSVASLPAMVNSSQRLGYSAQVTGLVLPLAVSLFRITSPIQYLAVVSFIAWAYGIDLSLGSTALCVGLSVIISIGSVGLPGQAIFMGTNLPVVQAAGLPIEPLGLLVAVDMIPDIFATLGNVTADLTVTSRVAKAEQKIIKSLA